MLKRYRLKRIKNLSILPRWVIFSLDIAISCICFLLAYLIRSEFDYNIWNNAEVFNNTIILLAFNVCLFALFRVYAGIIRFTGLQDTFRIFFVVFFANAGYGVLDMLMYKWNGYNLIAPSILIINTLLSFVALSSYRVIIKYFFAYITTVNTTKKRIAIYGASDVGMESRPGISKHSSSKASRLAGSATARHSPRQVRAKPSSAEPTNGTRYSPGKGCQATISRANNRQRLVRVNALPRSAKLFKQERPPADPAATTHQAPGVASAAGHSRP
jgi:hypothetical protein